MSYFLCMCPVFAMGLKWWHIIKLCLNANDSAWPNANYRQMDRYCNNFKICCCCWQGGIKTKTHWDHFCLLTSLSACWTGLHAVVNTEARQSCFNLNPPSNGACTPAAVSHRRHGFSIRSPTADVFCWAWPQTTRQTLMHYMSNNCVFHHVLNYCDGMKFCWCENINLYWQWAF